MGDNASTGKCSPLPLSALRLLVPPIQLVSAAVWQTVQQKASADYGMLEEFVSMVTDIVPELLTTKQRIQLFLGLRARLILDLCQHEATAHFELIQPHLDRLQKSISAWVIEVGAADTEVSHGAFVDLVKNLLENPEEREHFFQNVPEEFGPAYDEALLTLMWIFLTRLEKFVPLQTFQQVASQFGAVSTVLAECMDTLTQCEELTMLLNYHRELSQLDHHDISSDGACIISALTLPIVDRMESAKSQSQVNSGTNFPSLRTDLDSESLALPHTVHRTTDAVGDDQQDQMRTGESDWTSGEKRTAGKLADHSKQGESPGQSAFNLVKRCSVQLKKVKVPPSLHARPVRPNRGLRMKRILLEEKRDIYDFSMKERPSGRYLSGVSHRGGTDSFTTDSYMAPIDHSSDEDSWSYYSDENSSQRTPCTSPSMADSWSNYSDEEASSATPLRTSPERNPASSCSNKDPSYTATKNESIAQKKGVSKTQGATRKKKGLCVICKEYVHTSLRTHLKTHFPTGELACQQCGHRFKLYSSLKFHMNSSCYEYSQQQVDPERPDVVEKRYKCDKCEEAFRYKVSLDRHKMTHNERYCGVCRRVLRDAAAVARHKASHTLFQCNRCEESFLLFKPLLRHYENIHQVSRPFQCNQCLKSFLKLRLLILHEWKHTGHLPFQCTHCSMRFRTHSDLISHDRVHTREKPYLCAECGKTFAQKSNLLRHLNLIHSEYRNEKKHSCSNCEKSFKEKGALKKHQRSKHGHELFRHPCPYCGKMVSASTMARHKLIHTGERPFKCTAPECDKFFRSNVEVRNHFLRHHTSDRPYKCDVCGKSFPKMCFLTAHAKVHSGQKPFVCHICGKRFPRRYSMLRHEKLLHKFITK
ncbi:uncharacterized protein V6R79_023010 [Siganus canaliculatus]